VYWREVRIQELRREELMREAEVLRMAKKAGAGLPTWSGRLSTLMIRLGAWMERTGCRLQSRFAAIETSGMMDPVAEATLEGCA
jgi:hypothetical protein